MAELTEAAVLAGVREELQALKVPGAAEATMESEWRDLDIDSLELVEVNPVLDRENETAKLAVELAASALGARIL